MSYFGKPCYPARGVLSIPGQSTIVFATVHTRKRIPWLANPGCHDAIREAWAAADAWYIGRYVIMPDHINLFIAPDDETVEVERWVEYWKYLTTKALGRHARGWQTRCWHHRLRHEESYEEKWHYVLENPVRKGLVKKAEDWPYQGEITPFTW